MGIRGITRILGIMGMIRMIGVIGVIGTTEIIMVIGAIGIINRSNSDPNPMSEYNVNLSTLADSFIWKRSHQSGTSPERVHSRSKRETHCYSTPSNGVCSAEAQNGLACVAIPLLRCWSSLVYLQVEIQLYYCMSDFSGLTEA